MIIVSQNKGVIINFEKVNIININKLDERQIGAWFNCNEEENNNVFLGEYATEERAKEVLQEILKYYNSLKRKSVYAIGDGNFTFSEKFYYEMPKEW